MLRVKEDDKDLTIPRLDGGGVPVYYYKGEPFTGIVYQNHKNGTLFSEEEYVKGFQEGWIRYYFDNEKIEEECKCHNNDVIDNTFKKWDKNGNLVNSF